MSHPDVSLVNILLSITRVSLVQNKCVLCQLCVHYIIVLTRTSFGDQKTHCLQACASLTVYEALQLSIVLEWLNTCKSNDSFTAFDF